jgi:hypothetical protein
MTVPLREPDESAVAMSGFHAVFDAFLWRSTAGLTPSSNQNIPATVGLGAAAPELFDRNTSTIVLTVLRIANPDGADGTAHVEV